MSGFDNVNWTFVSWNPDVDLEILTVRKLKLELAAETEKRVAAEASHQVTKQKLKDVAPWPVQPESILYNTL